MWGYSIRAFSMYPEEAEILLEPEAKVDVTSVIKQGPQESILSIYLKLQPFEHLVLEAMIPVGGAKPKPRGSVGAARPTIQPTQKTSVYKEPSTVEEAVALLKQNNDNAETCEKLLRKLKDMVDNGKNEPVFFFF